MKMASIVYNLFLRKEWFEERLGEADTTKSYTKQKNDPISISRNPGDVAPSFDTLFESDNVISAL